MNSEIFLSYHVIVMSLILSFFNTFILLLLLGFVTIKYEFRFKCLFFINYFNFKYNLIQNLPLTDSFNNRVN